MAGLGLFPPPAESLSTCNNAHTVWSAVVQPPTFVHGSGAMAACRIKVCGEWIRLIVSLNTGVVACGGITRMLIHRPSKGEGFPRKYGSTSDFENDLVRQSAPFMPGKRSGWSSFFFNGRANMGPCRDPRRLTTTLSTAPITTTAFTTIPSYLFSDDKRKLLLLSGLTRSETRARGCNEAQRSPNVIQATRSIYLLWNCLV